MLLFSVQPMIAKSILPSYGGTAAVWTTCMMFFQIVLVLGYGYSHLLRRRLSPKAAFILHAIVLTVAGIGLLILPATPDAVQGSNLTVSIIVTLATSIGLPYFALSTTSSLVQAWHHTLQATRANPASTVSTYRLYALSNFGSLLALAAYPFLIEPWIPLKYQTLWWSWAFIGFAAICLWAGSSTLSVSHWAEPQENEDLPVTQNKRVSLAIIPIWFLLAFCPSVLLLATTNLMCQEIASVPFLWILPLSLYLLSFMICFDRPEFYRRRFFGPLLFLSVVASIGVVQAHIYVSIVLQVAGLACVCFSMAMVCHGELERLKPPPNQLTLFFLIVAIGGACGGVFVTLLAPVLFDSFLEFQLSLLLGIGLMIASVWLAPSRLGTTAGSNSSLSKYAYCGAALLVAAMVLASLMYQLSPEFRPDEIFRDRNEYGLVRVSEADGYRRFISGNVDHGGQPVAEIDSLKPSGYYGPSSGIGIASRRIHEINGVDQKNSSIAVVGMGIGAMLAWCEPEDQFTFYELNPLVEVIALEHFSYLSQFQNQATVNIGDGRVLLERQLEESGSGQFDIIAMDAFSSDAIPQHLLTIECFQLYLKHLAPDGILVAHITNRFVDLAPVVYSAAQELKLNTYFRTDSVAGGKHKTTWILLSRNADFDQADWMRLLECDKEETTPVRWTDDFASLGSVTRWSTNVDLDELKAFQQKANPK